MIKMKYTLLAIATLFSINTVQAEYLRFSDVLSSQLKYGDTENYSLVKYYSWVKDSSGYVLQESNGGNYNVAYYLSKSVPSIVEGVQNGIDPNAYNIHANFVGNEPGQSPYQIYDNGLIFASNELGMKFGNITADIIDSTYLADKPKPPIILEYSGRIGDVKTVAIENPCVILSFGNNTIGGISGIFIGNYGRGGNGGGAIENNGVNRGQQEDKAQVGDIEGLFIGNYVANDLTINGGGAIHSNQGTAPAFIGDIRADFIGNYAGKSNLTSTTYGGAIWNWDQSTINSITGNFIDNYAQGSKAYGGAIANAGIASVIGDITGDFIGNKVISKAGGSNGFGGAIYNEGTIADIFGNFASNSATSRGGGIFNSGDIASINGTFDSNSAVFSGGAIQQYGGTIESIDGKFVNNTATGGNGGYSGSGGGAINIYSGHVDSINGYFEGNSSVSYGGAISLARFGASVGSITGDFVRNTSNTTGAISAWGSDGIESISGNFIQNSAINDAGAIGIFYTTVGSIDGNFIENTSGYDGGAMTNEGEIGHISGNFLRNKTAVQGQGGAISNYGIIGAIEGYFEENSSGRPGGAIANNKSEITSISGEFYNNTSSKGGAIGNSNDLDYGSSGSAVIKTLTGYFKGNSASEVGGAVYNVAEITEFVNSTFVSNHAGSETADGKGGAIYTSADLVLSAKDGYLSEFKDNYIITGGQKEQQGIYVDNAKFTFNAQNNGAFLLNDKIAGSDYKIDFTGDSTGNIYLNDDILNSANINLYNVTFNLSTRDNVLDGSGLALNSGVFNMINNQTGTSALSSLSVLGNTRMSVDVDIQNKIMDRFTSDSYGTHSGNIIVDNMNILQHTEREKTYIDFAQVGLRDNVATTITEVYSPIYRYDVEYLKNSGQFLFSRGSGKSTFNPSILASPTATQSGAQAGINETFRYVFAHADAFTQFPMHVRFAKMNANKYAMSTNFNDNLPSFDREINNKGVWTRPYTTFETMNLKNGPSVDAVTYGTLIGFDSDFRELKNGWSNVLTGYIGYNGSSLNYSGADTTLNGGIVGFTETFYKKNFWTALTLSAGASVGESHTMYGKEDFTSLLAGIGSKTGYNFEFKEGKFIIQPIMFMSYTFVNTFDYTNAAGVSIESSPLHTVQINPSVRFITNFENGWQPYVSVGMVWNVLNESKVTANNVKLPEMNIKPYVEYGLGVQRNWADKFTAFFQTMIRNGGRNGVALTAGFRWALGSELKQNQKQKKILKEAI